MLCKSELKYWVLYAHTTLKKLLREIKSAPVSTAGGDVSSGADSLMQAAGERIMRWTKVR